MYKLPTVVSRRLLSIGYILCFMTQLWISYSFLGCIFPFSFFSSFDTIFPIGFRTHLGSRVGTSVKGAESSFFFPVCAYLLLFSIIFSGRSSYDNLQPKFGAVQLYLSCSGRFFFYLLFLFHALTEP